MQQERGCHGPAAAPFDLDGEELDRCPRRLVRWDEIRPVLDLWSHLTQGRYPGAGGYAEQPALFVDLLAEVDRLEAEANPPTRG